MKSILFLLSLICWGGVFETEQKTDIKENYQEDPRILKIRKWYGEIQKGLKSKTYGIKYDGDAVLYYDKKTKKLVHIDVGVYNDGHELVEEYYIKNDKIFFYYSEEIGIHEAKPIPEGMSQQEAWETGAMYDAKSYNVEQKRIYFDKDKIIRYLTKEAIIDVGKDMSKEMLKIKNKKENVNTIDASIYISQVNDYIKLIDNN